ncbi:hypothetical protein ACT4YP_13540 [Acinetobacter baumannii]
MFDLNKEREAFEGKFPKPHWIEWDEELGQYTSKHVSDVSYQARFEVWLEAKAQAVPTWISVEDEWPPTDIMVLICWVDAPDVTPEQDYMTIDEDLNSVWANYQNDPPSHWMHFHSVPNVSGAEG